MNAASRALAQSSLGAKGIWNIFLVPQQFTLILLCMAVFFSGMGVVYMKDLNRRLYRDIQLQQKQHELLQTEWSQLLLEQSAWSQQNRVERIASEQLQMIIPPQKNIIMVEN